MWRFKLNSDAINWCGIFKRTVVPTLRISEYYLTQLIPYQRTVLYCERTRGQRKKEFINKKSRERSFFRDELEPCANIDPVCKYFRIWVAKATAIAEKDGTRVPRFIYPARRRRWTQKDGLSRQETGNFCRPNCCEHLSQRRAQFSPPLATIMIFPCDFRKIA